MTNTFGSMGLIDENGLASAGAVPYPFSDEGE